MDVDEIDELKDEESEDEGKRNSSRRSPVGEPDEGAVISDRSSFNSFERFECTIVRLADLSFKPPSLLCE